MDYLRVFIIPVAFIIYHMLKIGIIGLGDIALKAYLPVMSKKEVEIHLFARNKTRLNAIGTRYRFQHLHQSLDELIHSGIKAAFVHTSTASHYEIVKTLLRSNVHVYVDKPVTYDLPSTEELIALADKNGLTIMAGFNRRYAPAYVNLKQMKDVNMILMQKNRRALPEDARTFIFDDFIHVVDTLLFLFPHVVEKIAVHGMKTDKQLSHVVVEFNSSNGAMALGIMNRDSGTVEERLEVFSPSEKRVVTNVSETIIFKDTDEIKKETNNWESTLHRRGFEQIVESFLHAASRNSPSQQLHRELLLTHRVCEQIVRDLS